MSSSVPPLIPGDTLNTVSKCNYLSVMNNGQINGNLTVIGDTTLEGSVNITGTINISLNDLNNVSISNPTINEVLKYNGIDWINASETNSAGGSTTQIQYNDNDTLTGSSDLTWVNSTKELTVNGTINCDTITDGNAVLTGGMLSGLNMPVNMTDAVNKAYVDNIVIGVSWKAPVVCATISPVDLSSPGSIIDGFTLLNSNRVLVKNGSTINPGTFSIDNGIYIFATSSTPMSRSTDMLPGTSAAGVAVFSEGGIDNNGSGFVCNTQPPTDVVGTDAITFVKFNTADVIIAGDALSKNGDILDVNVDTTNIDINLSNELTLSETGVTSGTYTYPNLTVDTYGRISSIFSITPTYYMTLNGVFNNVTSVANKFINWGIVPNSETIANPILLGRNGTIKMISITYVNSAAITITSGVSLSFSVGHLPTGSNPNTGFVIFSGGTNIISWTSANTGTWPSTKVELSIPVTSTTQLTMRSSRSAAIAQTTADLNVLVLIEF